MTNSASTLNRSDGRAKAYTAPRRAANDNLLLFAFDQFLLWRDRVRTRRYLAMMSDYQLKDIGISRTDAYNEADKPFWRD